MPLTRTACNSRAGTHWQFGRCHPAANVIRLLHQRLSETGWVVLNAYVNGDRLRNVITPANEDATIAAAYRKRVKKLTQSRTRIGTVQTVGLGSTY